MSVFLSALFCLASMFLLIYSFSFLFFFFQAEDGIRDIGVTGVQTCALPILPAAAILLTAHAELERLVGTIHQNQFKGNLDRQWGYLVYAGLWWEPLRSDLDAYMDSVNRWVTGEIGLKLYKGSVRVVTRESPHAVYDAQLATFAESGGLFSQQASPGFIEIWSLQSRLAWRLRNEEQG